MNQESIGAFRAPHPTHHIIRSLQILKCHIPALNHFVEFVGKVDRSNLLLATIRQANYHRLQIHCLWLPVAKPVPFEDSTARGGWPLLILPAVAVASELHFQGGHFCGSDLSRPEKFTLLRPRIPPADRGRASAFWLKLLRKHEQLIAALFEQMTREIILVQSLLDHDQMSGPEVIQACSHSSVPPI